MQNLAQHVRFPFFLERKSFLIKLLVPVPFRVTVRATSEAFIYE